MAAESTTVGDGDEIGYREKKLGRGECEANYMQYENKTI